MTARQFGSDREAMAYALELAARGLGLVEPNPAVGAVIVDDQRRLLGEGWHQQYGGPHAEVHAIAAAGERCRGATMLVTLEPCSHHGKTPPCAEAVIAAGIARVIVCCGDPNPRVNGRGIARLQKAGIDVETGLLEERGRRLIAPFVSLTTCGRPYLHAKWAMTLDGRIASRTGHSQWISGEQSRALVHQLRGRMDAILVGSGTVLADDPLLTARPSGPRTATRIVLDRRGRIPASSQICRTASEIPTLVISTTAASKEWQKTIAGSGAEVLVIRTGTGSEPDRFLKAVMDELGDRRMTNVLVEGGGEVLGSLFDAGLLDEYHVFVAPKVVGGESALPPLKGRGLNQIPDALADVTITPIGGDVYIHGFR